MNRLQRKAIWIKFKSDIEDYGFLAALNRLSFDVGCAYTDLYSLERELVYCKYRLRRARIEKLNLKFKKLKSKFKRG